MRYSNRPFLSASLLKETALQYCCNDENNLHKIWVPKGTRILPLRALGKDYGDKEAEVIFAVKHLKRTWNRKYYLNVERER